MTGSISRRLLLPDPEAAPLPPALRPAAALRCEEPTEELEPPADEPEVHTSHNAATETSSGSTSPLLLMKSS